MNRPNSADEIQKGHGNFEADNGSIYRSGILPVPHSSTGNPIVWHAPQGQKLTFDTNPNDVQPLTFRAEPAQKHVFQRGMDLVNEQNPLVNLYGEQFVQFYNAIWEDMPECDFSTVENFETEITDSSSSTFGPLNVADYDICEADVKDGVLLITDSETPNSISTDTTSLSQEVGCQMMEEDTPNTIAVRSLMDDSNLAFSVNPGLTSNVTQHSLRSSITKIYPATGPLAQQGQNWTLGTKENDVQPFPSVFNVNPSCTSNIMQYNRLHPVPDITSATIPDNQGGEQQFTPMSGVDQSPASQLAGNSTNDRLLLEKLLTKSDIRMVTTGVLVPKRDVELNFPTLSDELELTLHDAYHGSTWTMRLTVSKTDGLYRLKDFVKYMDHYSLNKGDFLRIFLDVPGSRYVVKFEKQKPIHMPTELVNTATDIWILAIRKKLTKTDAQGGFQGLGSVYLGKRDIQAHFPKLQGKEGYAVRFVDCEAKRLWDMTLKFKSEKAGRIYLLQNVREYLTFHSLAEGDVLEVLKSESSPVTYALRARKLL